MERIGIVGLPNSGKSSLFNALTGGDTPVAAHPFSTTETSVGIAQVYDHRLVALAEMSQSKNVVSATLEFADQAGLVAGASAGEGLGNRFLAGIREVDALCLVLRAFEDENVVGDSNPLSDFETLELELVLADATTVANNVDKRRRAAKTDKSLLHEVAALEAVEPILQEGVPLWRAALSPEHRAGLATFSLLTAKRAFAVVNVGDDQLDRTDELVAPIEQAFAGAGEALAVCVQLEAEAAQMDPEGKAELLDGLGLGEGALPPRHPRRVQAARPAHVPDDGREGEPRVDFSRRRKGARVRGRHPFRSSTRLHPRRVHRVGRAARSRLVEQGQRSRQAPRRRQGLRSPGRRHSGDPLQHMRRS